MEEVTYQIHWLAVTVHADKQAALLLHELIFKDRFGDLFPLGYGGRSFKEIQQSILAMKYYFQPNNESMNYFHLEIPGLACEAIPPDHFVGLKEYLDGNHPGCFNATRMDLAFDHVGFTPEEFYKAIHEGKARSLAKRKSLIYYQSPDEIRDDGIVGTETTYFGSRNSDRMVRVYNKRGFNRLELQTKNERANLIMNEMLDINNPDKWLGIAMSHLRDFLDIDTVWWRSFTSGFARANKKVTDPKQVSLDKLRHYIDYQVSPALSVFIDTHDPAVFESVLKRARQRRGKKYDPLLHAFTKDKGLIDARAS